MTEDSTSTDILLTVMVYIYFFPASKDCDLGASLTLQLKVPTSGMSKTRYIPSVSPTGNTIASAAVPSAAVSSSIPVSSPSSGITTSPPATTSYRAFVRCPVRVIPVPASAVLSRPFPAWISRAIFTSLCVKVSATCGWSLSFPVTLPAPSRSMRFCTFWSVTSTV